MPLMRCGFLFSLLGLKSRFNKSMAVSLRRETYTPVKIDVGTWSAGGPGASPPEGSQPTATLKHTDCQQVHMRDWNQYLCHYKIWAYLHSSKCLMLFKSEIMSVLVISCFSNRSNLLYCGQSIFTIQSIMMDNIKTRLTFAIFYLEIHKIKCGFVLTVTHFTPFSLSLSLSHLKGFHPAGLFDLVVNHWSIFIDRSISSTKTDRVLNDKSTVELSIISEIPDHNLNIFTWLCVLFTENITIYTTV